MTERKRFIFLCSNELVEPAADALLPLVLCNTALYQVIFPKCLSFLGCHCCNVCLGSFFLPVQLMDEVDLAVTT
jgi:hypothetical protein